MDAAVPENRRVTGRVLRGWPLRCQLGAVSLGVVEGDALCDLNYKEDSSAEVDLNLVMTSEGEFIEIQGSAEQAPFSRESLNTILEMGEAGIRQVFQAQKASLES